MGLLDDISKNLGSLTGNSGKNEAKGNGLGGLLGSAAVGGLLGALLGGSKSVQRTARNAAVIGAGAGAAALAYKIYQKWRNSDVAAPQSTQPQPNSPLSPTSTLPRSVAVSSTTVDDKAQLLIEAMVFAARADGHIDDEEQALILKSAQDLGCTAEIQQLLASCMNQPLDPEKLAQRIASPEEARDVYFLSAIIIKADTFMEKSYLSGLAQACGLDDSAKADIDARATQARASMLQS